MEGWAPKGRMKAGNCPVRGTREDSRKQQVKCCWEVGALEGGEQATRYGDKELLWGKVCRNVDSVWKWFPGQACGSESGRELPGTNTKAPHLELFL